MSSCNKDIKIKIVHTPDVFETKANNAGLKEAEGDKLIIVQDDMVVKENGWNETNDTILMGDFNNSSSKKKLVLFSKSSNKLIFP